MRCGALLMPSHPPERLIRDGQRWGLQDIERLDVVGEGAARAGRTPDRNAWRIIRDVYVPPTDTAASDLAINGIMGRCWIGGS